MQINMTINGQPRSATVQPMTPLLFVLREHCGLTGTKYGCGEGECGACSVLLNGELVMSCLVPAIQCDGATIETIEGLAGTAADGSQELHPLQRAFLECGGAQCGICTPGMVMAGVQHLRRPELAPGGMAEALEGNLCRCTGYAAIFRAMEAAAKELGADAK